MVAHDRYAVVTLLAVLLVPTMWAQPRPHAATLHTTGCRVMLQHRPHQATDPLKGRRLQAIGRKPYIVPPQPPFHYM